MVYVCIALFIICQPETTNERYPQADHTCVYPRRYGPAAVSPSKNMRLRYFLRHPDQMKGRHEFMQVLTARTDLGIEFVEGWQLSRIAVAILLPVLASLVLAVLYSALYGDVSGAFTIAGECLRQCALLLRMTMTAMLNWGIKDT